jgi:hypothetical protein
VQKIGEATRDMRHKADWDPVKMDPTSVELPYRDYILKFDCYKFAEENFERIADEIRQGRTERFRRS